MTRLVTIIAITIGLIACQSNGQVFEEHKELSPKLEWLKKDAREFQVPINDSGINYDLSLSFRYVTGYQYQSVNVKVTETSPSGNETVKEYELKVKDSKGDYIGDVAYDIWDSKHLIEPNKAYKETGIYSYRIEQNMADDPLDFVMEIGILLNKVK